MFRQVIHNYPQSNITTIQIGEVDDITISSSRPMNSHLAQQIRHVSNNHIDRPSAMMSSGLESSAAQSTSANRLTVSMQCTNISSEDVQLVPNMALNMTECVDPNISLYTQSETFNIERNIVNYGVSSLSELNYGLPELERASSEQIRDLREYINQLDRGQVAQPVAENELSPLHAEENGINSTLNVEVFNRLLAQREQEDFYDSNIDNIRAAERRAAEGRAVESEELIINRDLAPFAEVEMVGGNLSGWEENFIPIEKAPNGRHSLSSVVGSSERLSQNSAESISSARAPMEGDDPSING
ncbi:hypothetical protein QE197_09210 [Arsenophonus nasoniae]|uniref:Uncharacterized protein n=1 Tax=Arsenophonus nasoniae TaxID=638 RepID=D2TW19_9GAMM|nr:hypothetical protein [Arsenophonus nasoniae]QBY43617.1 hypothetical protein ArsFIN_21850 [Arsenophonus nasoniae]WGM00106.1 hypothetical protein QE210_09340 [Arsenophonus nasoniae]WGM07619.1 hypothetical protein QE258_10485 [Arsenophonus nasoniae]WGM12422.1 hypothetical protein QE197_09210 [Arsenophonus nasoniae]WGM17101.1 hypothetical protein QE193_09100 [Arsenophonus nasoniae]